MILVGREEESNLLNMIGERKGSIVSYFGYVRDFAHGKKVSRMVARENEKTEEILEKIEKEIRKKYPVVNVLLYHSIGDLKPGDLLAAVIISSVHRKEGFEACRYGIDRIKELEPVTREEF